MTSGTCPTIRLRLNCLRTSSQDFHQGRRRRPLEKGAVWSYWKHHHSINTQSSLGKLEQLDIQQGQPGQVQAHQGLHWLGDQIRAMTHQRPNSAKHLVPSGSYQHKLINLKGVALGFHNYKKSQAGHHPTSIILRHPPHTCLEPGMGWQQAMGRTKQMLVWGEREREGSQCG